MAGTRSWGPGHRSAQAGDRFRGRREGRVAGGREPSPAGLDELDLVRFQAADGRRDEHLPVIEEARAWLFGDHKPVDSLIGVDRLSPGYLIEVEAIAVTGG